MTPILRPNGLLRSALTLVTVLAPMAAPSELVAQAARRAVSHDDYDSWPSLRGATYSRDGRWMGYAINPRVGDGVLYVREVDGDTVYTFERGERLSFSNDGKLAMFKVEKSYEEERRKKLEKLHAKKEEKKGGEAEEEEGLPPDVKKALAERGMTEAQAQRMIERRGASMAEVRAFLGLPEPEAKSGEKPAKKSEKSEAEKAAEKEAKALAKRLHVLDLRTGEVTKIENVDSYRQPREGDLLVLHFAKPEEDEKDAGKADKGEKTEKGPEPEKAEKKAKAEKEEPAKAEQTGSAEKGAPAEAGARGEKAEPKKEPAKEEQAKEEQAKPKPKADPLEKKRKDGTRLVLRDLATGKDEAIEHVLEWGFVADATWLWNTVGSKKAEEGVQHGLFARELSTGLTVALLRGYSDVSGVTTDEANKQLAFTSDLRTFGEDEPRREVYLWAFHERPARRVVDHDTQGVPEGFRIQSGGLDFSRDGTVLTFGVKPPKKDELPKILPEDQVDLDLWHWQDGQLQTMQAKRPDPNEATRTAVYHLDVDRALVLGTEDEPRLSLITDDGSRALLSDSTPYEQQTTWDGRYADYYVVNTVDGSRKKIVEGLRGSASTSAGGRYVIWFDHRDYDWHTYDVQTGRTRNLTADVGVPFDRTEDDRPEPHGANGLAGWTENDAEVLVYDEFDVWAISPETGAFRCVTDGLGRASNTRFRLGGPDLRPDAERDDYEKRRWLRNELQLAATDQNTYAEGFYADTIEGVAKPRKLFMKDASIDVTRPQDADRLFVTFSRFDQYPDVWTTNLDFGAARQLTDACPILRDVRWGTAELVHWRSDDGVELKGYLVKPDGFDATKKWPMMVYFYERSSSRIHRFVAPDVGTSPNAAYYVSNGYLWFVPDIVYTDGYPGESCEKCVVSGVQHLLAQGFVDREAIGAAGHSWGGYQTAHLITRTDIFAAVESGAPVVNMYSAYGGIRWGSGMSRQFQYEQTQSRIGGSIWEYPMRYWENSPLFHLDKVKTPVLILHNDKDGAVPWYQGIEFFVAMRRLGKEAYLFNYNDEDHGLRKRQNQRDWTRRMQEYFDHHLRGAPAPAWMQRGVPFHERMAEKIPHAKSYQEAVDAGLIEKIGEPRAKASEATPAEASATGGGPRER